MTTQEIADRLVELCKEGKNVQAEEELYAQNAQSFELDPKNNKQGLENIIAGTKAAFAGVKEVRKSETTLVGVNNDSFLVRFEMDIAYENGNEMKMDEYGFYKVENGKVSEEYFFVV